jgi:prepilin-type N-terminal cleavage/methylation domain-containing protein
MSRLNNFNPKSKQSGFTLVEALVSVAILSIGFAGLYGTIGASMSTLEHSNARGQLDYFSQTVLNDVTADATNLEQYQLVVDNALQPLALNMGSSCSESTAYCSNRNRWNGMVQTILGSSAEASLEVHPLCSPTLTTACPLFGSDAGVRRSAVLTVTISFGRGSYSARRVIDVRDAV